MQQSTRAVPQHIAIIMDGNGRWAKKRLLPRVAGHKKGVDTIKKIAIRAKERGVKIVTVYAFSTENWGRPEEEVKFLMKLPKEFFASFIPELLANDVRIEIIGDLSALPVDTQRVLEQAMNQTAHCQSMVLNFALNYGGRVELLEAVKSVCQRVKDGDLTCENIQEADIEQALSTAKFGKLASPDLLIRTSGEQRLSNFLLWQVAYSELYFTDVLWPDFSVEDFDRAIESYQGRHRRFGKL